MARFLADEQYPARVQSRLRRLGHNVVHIRRFDENKAGSGISDDRVLRIAMAESRIILTLNRKHFFALHESGQFGGHRGIIACDRDDASPDFQAKKIDELIKSVKHLDAQFFVVRRKLTRRERRSRRRHTEESGD
jgi:hypothetical protein